MLAHDQQWDGVAQKVDMDCLKREPKRGEIAPKTLYTSLGSKVNRQMSTQHRHLYCLLLPVGNIWRPAALPPLGNDWRSPAFGLQSGHGYPGIEAPKTGNFVSTCADGGRGAD